MTSASKPTPANPESAPDIWTVYYDPLDYKGLFVARLWRNYEATETVFTSPNIETLRDMLPEGLYRLPRNSADDLVILETWL